MRRLLAVVFLLLGVPLLAAAPNAFYSKPTVVVYPFSTNSTSAIDREAISRLATVIASEMANTGKVVVTPAPPATERKDFLSVARLQRADYYVSGYISPLGNGVSVVEQVVSATSGIVVYSQTRQIVTFSDAAGQGDDLATFISRHANRGLADLPPPAEATPTPEPSSGPGANLNKLFSRRKRDASTPAPSTAPASSGTVAAAAARTTEPPKTVAAAPASSNADAFAVLAVAGAPEAALREAARDRVVARTAGVRAESTAAACNGHAPRALLSGILAVKPNGGSAAGGTATFELAATDCAGKVLWRESRSTEANTLALATEHAVDAAVDAYLHPPKRRR